MAFLIIFGIFVLWGMSSEKIRTKILGGVMAGTFMGCLATIFTGFVIIGGLLLAIPLMANPVIILPLFLGMIIVIFVLRITGN